VRSHRVFAAIYEHLLAANEDAGLRELRAGLLRSARGRTLEIGAGTGLNLAHYTHEVTELVLTEPDPAMAKRLRARLDGDASLAPAGAKVHEAAAEALPFPESSFDTVVTTLVLCSVHDPEAALAEVARVLKPGGDLLFAEHVRDADGSRRARWQARLDRPWSACMGGCHPGRETDRLIDARFVVHERRAAEFPGPGTALVKPLVSGVARLPA
jgi:SAM-dependent methyltransferase